jgi:glycerol-3-phosphate dehydrogenase
MAGADFARWFEGFRADFPWLPDSLARHYGHSYGTRARALLEGAASLDDLGRHFGGELYEREARWLAREEWARSAEDVLERRTKHGIFLSASQRKAFAEWLELSLAA